MRMKTYNKRRKIRSGLEYIKKYMMDFNKVSKKDICCSDIFMDKKGKKNKYFIICVDKTNSLNVYPPFEPLRPHFYDNYPFGEFQHPSVVRNENIVNKNKHNKSKIKYTLNDDFTVKLEEEYNENSNIE